MKKLFTIFSCLLLVNLVFGQTQWTSINPNGSIEPRVEIIDQSNSGLTIKLLTNSYVLKAVETSRGSQSILLSPDFSNSNDKGTPDLAHYSKSIIIPNSGTPNLQVLSSEYQLLSDVQIAPSKGTITRNINPADVSYEYGELYDTDIFFPNEIANLSEPFIIRDYRGVSINYSPFVYNAFTKELRVYSEIIVKIEFTNNRGANELSRTNEPVNDFETVYEDMFINFGSRERYSPLSEGSPGKILIVCADNLAPAMKKYINWKREKGIETEMVLMSTIGKTSKKLKTFIKNYYNKNAMTYVLLVGDHEGVPTTILKNGGGDNIGPDAQGHNDLDSDNKYAYIVGNDNYADVFIGRFSGSKLAHIQTQVDRSIYYEKSMKESDTWIQTCMNTGSDEGYPTDEEHLNRIAVFLKKYGYSITNVHEVGGNLTKMKKALNKGLGVVNYTGHGNVRTWYNVAFSNTHIKALNNKNKLPFIWSVACLNGQFRGSECFAETWLQAKKNNKPTGAVAILASTILQAWEPPKDGQVEMNRLLVNSYKNNKKRTIGGISFNGIFKMLERNNNSAGKRTADTWTLFGDPSLMVRTKTPGKMNITHKKNILPSAKSFVIKANVNGALATISKIENGEVIILGQAFVNKGAATIPLKAIGRAAKLTLTVTAFDKITYQKNLTVLTRDPSEARLMASPLSFSFETSEENKIIQITSNVNWTAVSSETWLTINQNSGSNDGSLVLTADVNEGGVDRTAIITLSGDNGVKTKTITVTQSKPSSISENKVIANVNVYPNPSSDYVHVSADFIMYKLRLINTIGDEVYSLNCESNQVTIPLENLKGNIYLLEIFDRKGNVSRKKIVVQ